MLLAHATGFHGLIWQPMAASLHGWHLIAPDFRLHGDSTYPDDLVLDWWDVGRDVLASVDAFAVDSGDAQRPVGVGHSMGGAALVLAELERPGTFRALWLYEPIIFPLGPRPADDENPMVISARKRRPWFNDRDEAYENYASKPPLDELSPACLRAYVDHGFADADDGTVTLKCLPEREAQNYGMGGAQGSFERLGELALPVVVAHGQILHPGAASIAPLIAEQIEGCRVRVYDDLHHFGPLAQPERIAADIQTDFTELLGGDRSSA
jgi:pimeloyl-ACP methyl ester carboxylesterase